MSHTLPTPIGGKHGRSTPAAEPSRERMPLVERTEPASHDQGTRLDVSSALILSVLRLRVFFSS